MINLESIILAAGYCSRFNFKNDSFKKYMLPFERSNILNYVIIAMHYARIDKVNIIVDEKADIIEISESYSKLIKKIGINTPHLNFIKNRFPKRENGYSLFLGVQEIKSDYFILSMADHVFSENIYLNLIKVYNGEDIILATDPMEIKGFYDLNDCTKVYGDNLRIKSIGKNIPNYNRLDMGVFIMKTNIIQDLSQKIEKEKDNFGVSDIVLKAIDLNLEVKYFDRNNTIWVDVDNDIEYKKIEDIFYKSTKYRPFNLDLFQKEF